MARMVIGDGPDALRFDIDPPAYLSRNGEIAWRRGFNAYIGCVQMLVPPGTPQPPYTQRMSRAAYLEGWDAAKRQHHSEVHRQQEA